MSNDFRDLAVHLGTLYNLQKPFSKECFAWLKSASAAENMKELFQCVSLLHKSCKSSFVPNYIFGKYMKAEEENEDITQTIKGGIKISLDGNGAPLT
jgi:hypothetical protein